MASLDDFDRQVKAVTSKGKLSSSVLQSIVDAALDNIQNDSRLISVLYRYHKKASAANKLTSLYLIDGIAREARSRQKKLDREAKGKGRDGAAQSPSAPPIGSTTPTKSPPPAASPALAANAGVGTYVSFLKLLEGGMLAKFVLDNWENGLPEHREKVRKVLDIWTKAATFSSSAMARVSQKLLAAGSSSSSSSKTARVASPARPSLSPDLSPGPESRPPASTAPGSGSNIPANVLALLQASSEAPPSQAAVEQKRQEELQAEVERVLREAQMGSKGSSSTAYSSASLPGSGYSAPASYTSSAPSHSTAPSTSTSSSSSVPLLALDASQLAALQQIAGGLNGLGALPPSQPAASSNGAGHGQRPGHGPPQAQQQQYQQQQPYDGPRGQTRSYDEAQHGYGHQHDAPPAKRLFQPAPPQQQQHVRPPPPPPQHAPPYQSTPSYTSSAPPPAPTAVAAAPAPAPSPAAQTASPAPGSSSSAAPSTLDPSSSFDATSAHSWSTFVHALRSAHPFFAGRPTPPTMDEVMALCVPSAMMAFGAGTGGAAAGQQGAMGMGMGLGTGENEAGATGEAGQGGCAGGEGGFAGAEGGY
ncbi:hypothetical protein JCM9279_004126 [Rhodotorula babjevae]